MEPIRDLATVSSLSGPGAVAGWLCSIVSVLVPWFLTSRDQHKTRISNDVSPPSHCSRTYDISVV
ncbi:hypothetical protein K491DRAFT_686647 [Lophiostoma macrostomum CBS 122681]|uniref:Uncharacterized protein n=1 Tax=Lophiostoma macrostomum CBS 122681 TaxID=1314788 RepID=A0A6A6TRU3_9PLEO|nr:hypothetical protein K491DRAFT_686647 [Lophiostoma macrostomum CBS 122681]